MSRTVFIASCSRVLMRLGSSWAFLAKTPQIHAWRKSIVSTYSPWPHQSCRWNRLLLASIIYNNASGKQKRYLSVWRREEECAWYRTAQALTWRWIFHDCVGLNGQCRTVDTKIFCFFFGKLLGQSPLYCQVGQSKKKISGQIKHVGRWFSNRPSRCTMRDRGHDKSGSQHTSWSSSRRHKFRGRHSSLFRSFVCQM